MCKGRKDYFGDPIHVVGAGGIADGRGLAAALSLGAAGIWVGTRFVAAVESAAPPMHKQGVVGAKSLDTMRTLVVSWVVGED